MSKTSRARDASTQLPNEDLRYKYLHMPFYIQLSLYTTPKAAENKSHVFSSSRKPQSPMPMSLDSITTISHSESLNFINWVLMCAFHLCQIYILHNPRAKMSSRSFDALPSSLQNLRTSTKCAGNRCASFLIRDRKVLARTIHVVRVLSRTQVCQTVLPMCTLSSRYWMHRSAKWGQASCEIRSWCHVTGSG